MLKKTGMLAIVLMLVVTGTATSQVQNLDFKTLQNKKVTLKDYLEKGPVLLDFWATWCKPCLKAFPKLNVLHEKYKERGLTILGINEDGPRSRAKIKPFVNSLGIKFEILIDPNNEIMQRLNLQSLPTSMLISPDGNIVSTFVGARASDYKDLEADMLELLQADSKDNEE